MKRPKRLAALATATIATLGVVGGLAVAAPSAANAATAANAAITAPSPDICDLGYVWREAVPGDHVCVTPDVRSQAAYDNSQAASRVDPNGAYGPDTCIQGYVWRQAIDSDHVCVTPDVRAQAWSDNGQAASRAIGNGITMNWNPITFDNGVPVGGWASLTVYGNGQYEFAGHYHDSGFTSYNTNTVWAGTAELITGGSRDHDWDNSGYNSQLQANWSHVQQQGWNWQANANTSLDFGTLFNEIKQVIGYVQTVISVVGPLLA
jgi:hypothetical protein